MSDSTTTTLPDETDSSPVKTIRNGGPNGSNRNSGAAILDDSVDHPLSTSSTVNTKKTQEWVKFDDTNDDDASPAADSSPSRGAASVPSPSSSLTATPSTKRPTPANVAPAVLDTESMHVTAPPYSASPTSDPSKSTPIPSPVKQTATSSSSASTPTNGAVHKNLHHSQQPSRTLSSSTSVGGGPAVIEIPINETTDSGDGLGGNAVATTTGNNSSGLRTIELSGGRVREGFANGDIIVTLLPVNTKWPWITPAVFRPELVPEELMAQGLTLTVEEYVHAMETLVNDYRFTLYNICYKRILCCWIVFAFSVLMGLLFSGLNGIALFSLGVGWLFLNASAIFLCMWLKLRLSRGLERCMAAVNRQLLRHKIIVVLDDRGHISCHKVNLCFMYYEPARCVKFLNEYIARSEQNGVPIEAGWEARLDVEVNDIVIQGSQTTRVSRKQDRGELVLLRYMSRWGRDVMRGRADVSAIEPARHCAPFVCPCQFIEAHLTCKPRGKSKYVMLCDGILSAESCNSITFIFFSIFLILGIYALYMVDFQRHAQDAT